MTEVVLETEQEYNRELARLRWQCRRGMLELDAMLQSFLDKSYQHLTQQEISDFGELLNYPDQELLEYLMVRKAPEEKDFSHVITKIRQAAGP